ncbi:MBL fold metallo-hydrolase [Stieleria sp. ICT_E10.1]|uniref:MBL fold metallo-hydrolase n=1 Tax=Stieleria sedimenti TaxID=2976331 RepID=UPI0021803135|nr:MBL fold metallo-hydrolase [Stieleria sedimenti]MCS7468984.1 MBL fold metallo-hydrolase [Stieleria sedimenti]
MTVATLVFVQVALAMLVTSTGCSPSSPPPPGKPMETLVPAVEKNGDSTTQYPTQWLGGQTLTVAPGVHVLGEISPSAVHAIETDDGIILIDSGGDEQARGVRESLLSVGLRLDDVRYILITHAHYDHVFGVNKIREMSGATVAAGKDDCEILRTADLPALYSVFPKIPYSGDPIAVDVELQDGDTIEWGGVTIEALATPGHTPGSTCYLLNKDDQQILFCGDVISSIDFGPATYAAKLSPKYRGDAEAFVATVDRLLHRPPPDLLLTGHPRQQKRLQSIRLDQTTWKGLLEPARAELQAIADRHQRDGADFLDGSPKQIEPGLYYLGDLEGTAVYALLREEQLFVVNAPGGEGLVKFLMTRLASLGVPQTTPAAILLTSDLPEPHSGLTSVAKSTVVFAPRSVADSLRADGHVVNTPTETDAAISLPVEVTELPIGLCYSYSTGGKTVLLTPAAPRNVSLVWKNRLNGHKTMGDLQPQMSDLITELNAAADRVVNYRKTLETLSRFEPDVWLPSLPLTDQNANLYDDDWQDTLENNLRPVETLERRY